MTVVSFATSAPELLVSLNAALSGSPAIAINNVVGSNIANIGLVLGITAIIGSIAVDQSFYKVNWPVMMLFSGALYYFLWNDNQLVASEGIVLFIALIIFTIYLIRSQKKATINLEAVDDALSVVSNFKIGIWFLIGAVSLYFGSEWLVRGATEIAIKLGVTEAVIGVTMIAIGTSVPELAASVIAAVKKEKAISLGNLIGSNIFNIGSVLGVTSIIKTIPVTEPFILSRDIFWMLLFAVSILVLAMLPKRNEINKIKGFVIVVLYGVFIFVAFKG
jgi:cation:H+ antiporter